MREWREFRGYNQDEGASRIGIDRTTLSKIERGLTPYNQSFLEAAAEAYMTDPASLIMRNPSDQDAIWTIWDQAKPAERETISELARTIMRRRQ